MRLLKILLLLLFAGAVVLSCKKSETSPDGPKVLKDSTVVTPTVPTSDVYICGNLVRSNYSENAVYWKNGTLALLTAPDVLSSASAIVAKGLDVYIAGTINEASGSRAVYWKNGTEVSLGKGAAFAIALDGNDIYVAGSANTGPGTPSIATYWKNGIPVSLPNPVASRSSGLPNSSARAITVSDNVVYAAGNCNTTYGGGITVATYWKNGAATALTKYYESFALFSARSHANSITLNEGNVFITGDITAATDLLSSSTDISGPVYWKNGIPVALANGALNATASGLVINGSDVWVCGVGFNETAVYWKNGISTRLVDNTSFFQNYKLLISPTGMVYFKNNLYISGHSVGTDGFNFTEKHPAYWKFAYPVILPTNNSSCYATGIAVVAR